MLSKPHLSIGERLAAAHRAIANSLAEAEIQPLVTKYGYSAEELQKGMALFEQADVASEAQIVAAGAQQAATGLSRQAELAARAAYQKLAKVARAVYQSDRPRLVALGLNGAEPASAANFIAAARALFDNAATTSSLSDRGYDAAELAAGRALITAFALADEKQDVAKGIAQQATQTRDAVLEKLDAWRAQYVKIARVALQGEPQLLERIGVPARTSKTRAQQAAGNRQRTSAASKKAATPSV